MQVCMEKKNSIVLVKRGRNEARRVDMKKVGMELPSRYASTMLIDSLTSVTKSRKMRKGTLSAKTLKCK